MTTFDYEAIAHMPTGNWCKFDTVSRARAFTMAGTPVHVGPTGLTNFYSKVALEGEIRKLTGEEARYSKDKTAAADKLWRAVLLHGKDPYERKTPEGEVVKIKAGPKRANQVFKINGATDEVIAKLPRQAKVIVDAIRELKEKEGDPSYDRLKKKLQGSAAQLKTKQDPWRIFSYYRARLIEDGILKIDRA